MAIPNTLSSIRDKVRRVTARTSPNQLSDTDINDYINTYYLYDFPEELRCLKLKDTYRLQTQPNIDTYALPLDTYMSFESPAYIAGEPMAWYQEPEVFFRTWPKINYIQQIATGDGTPGPYSGSITGTPFLRSVNPLSASSSYRNLLITANTSFSTAATAFDDGAGGLIDAASELPLVGSTVDYESGAVVITFASNIPSGTAINAEVIPYVASRPRSFLLFQSQLVFRPVPDKAYEVQMTAYRVPTSLIADGQAPELLEWGQLLSLGASLKIFEDYGDFEQRQAYMPIYNEYLTKVNRRTLEQLRMERVTTIYSDQNAYPFGNFYPYI